MARILILGFLVFAAWYLWQYVKALPKHQQKKIIRSWGLMLLLGVCLLLVATGRMHWVGALIAAALPAVKLIYNALIRLFPLLQIWQRHQGGPSRLRSQGLEITINFADGSIDGQVFTGPCGGRLLSNLNEQELKQQLDYFQQQDTKSALLLRAYMMRKGFAANGTSQGVPPSSSEVSREEALQILGLEEGASDSDIIRAHKQLIQKLHPDKGGNDYLAAKVNAAKDALLKK